MPSYEVMYKCYVPLFEDIPVLCYKYRKAGTIVWSREKMDIDRFAKDYWNMEYYDGVPCFSVDRRMHILKDILINEYDGDAHKYIRSVIEYNINKKLIDKKKFDETAQVSMALVSGGWKHITVDLQDDLVKTKKYDMR